MNDIHPQQYIVMQDSQVQESVATRYLVQDPLSRERLFGHLEISDFCWMVLELRIGKICPEMQGDIDILAGPLAWCDPQNFARTMETERLALPPKFQSLALAWRQAAFKTAASGGIAWPPALDYLVGIEIKRAYRDARGRLQSTKGGRGKLRTTHKELKRDLLDLCLDRVALVDIIAHSPEIGTGSDPWLAAGALASDSLRSMESILSERLKSDNSPVQELYPVAQFAWSVGSIEGGDETIRGAVSFDMLRQAKPNPSRVFRSPALEQSLLHILTPVPRPTTWPLIMKDCRCCDHIHLIDGPCTRI